MERVCRICLEEGAELPIFQEDSEHWTDVIKNKITVCLQDEIQDIDGYPKNICDMCNSTLDMIFSFINRYKENSIILRDGLEEKIKQQIIDQNLLLEEAEVVSESDLTLAAIKQEVELGYDTNVEDIMIDFVKEEHAVDKPRKIRKIKKENAFTNKVLKKRLQKQVKTNKIASSILEGVYCWTGGHWSYSKHTIASEEKPAIKERLKQIRKKMSIKKRKKAIKCNPEKLCDICGKVLKNQDKLSKHKLKFHSTVTYKCPYDKCNKVCNTKFNLDRHYKRRHSNERNYICNVCGKTFAFKAELTHHIKLHNRVKYPRKTFSCQYCDKTYKCQKSVDIHERSVHTGIRPAICSVCDSAFFHDDYLKEHMRLHTGETPFKCPICDRGYAQRGNMKSHLRIHRFSELDEATRLSLRPNYFKLLKM